MPNATCDLHLHTHYSDGRASPAEILRHAAEIGLKTVAITDHDNFHAFPEATHMAGELGLELIPGVEITARWTVCPSLQSTDELGQDIDILAYFFDPGDAQFIEFIRQSLEDTYQRVEACCHLLSQRGISVGMHHLHDENPRYSGAAQLVSSLWHLGFAQNWNEALRLFNTHWSMVRLARFSHQQVIEAIHAAGGVAVLAHPVFMKCNGDWIGEDQAAGLASAGLDGLEIYHPRMDPAARAHYRSLAGKFGWIVTGGSDEHGGTGEFSRLGSELVTYEMVHAARQRAARYGHK